MRSRILVVGDSETVFGLGLLGLEGRVVASAEEARRALHEASADSGIALVLLGENWAGEVPDAANESGPLIVEIPSSTRPARSNALEERIERALGVRIA